MRKSRFLPFLIVLFALLTSYGFAVKPPVPMGPGEFQTGKQFAVGASPSAIAFGDVNGDGKQDLAVANLGSNSVSILLGNGDGTFQPKKNTGTVPSPAGLGLADFNGDGKLDLATVQKNGSTVDILLGKGNGTFGTPTTLTASGACTSLLVGDFNGDTKNDIAVGCASGITVFLSNGDGTFQAAKISSVGASFPIAAADLNKDNKLDLMIPGGSATSVISVLLGNGDGTFQAAKNSPAQADPISVAAGDFNKDGKLDLAVGNGNFAGITTLIGNGDGTFQAGGGSSIDASSIASVATGDFNADGIADVAGVGPSTNGVVDYMGNGTNLLTGPVYYGSSVAPTAMVLVDVNGDKKLDMAIVNTTGDVPGGLGSVTIILGVGNGFFQGARDFPVGPGTCASNCTTPSIATADFNGDGFLDLVAANQQDNVLNLLLGNGDSTFQAHIDFPLTGMTPSSLTVADFNKDGKMDVAVANQCTSNVTCDVSAGSVSIFLGNGNATFQPAVDLSTGGENPVWITNADFNKDGNLDLAVSAAGDCTIKILLGNGNGTFQSPLSTSLPGCGNGMFVAQDFNKDGILDVAVVEPNAFALLLGNGDGTFQPGTTTPSTGAAGLVAADLNRDGNFDLAVSEGQGVNIFLGNGNGTYQAAKFFAADALSDSVVTDDFNGDGIPDLAMGASPAVDVLIGKGDGTFNPSISYPAGGSSYTGSGSPLVTSDFNRDGSKDILIAYQQTGLNTNVFEIFNNTGGNRLTLTSSPNPSSFGQTVTLSATVTATGTISGRPAPTGTIMFFDGTVLLSTVTMTNSKASFPTSMLTTGTHSLTAVYSGDNFYNPNTSAIVKQTVNKASTTTGVTSSQNPSTFGQPVTFTATVTSSTSGIPTGMVTFKDGTTPIGSGTLNGSGQTSFMTSSLARGSHSITAVYRGDTNFKTSTSPVLTQTVN
jgi:hypothetical protein